MRVTMRLIRKQFIQLLMMVFGVFILVGLSACGGGEGTGTADGEPLSEGVNIISFAKTSDGTETRSVTTDDSITVKIRLLSASNQPIENERVIVVASVGDVAESSLTV